jgi:hypothetical protein
VWKYRADARREAGEEQARALVIRAWTSGQFVPLHGLQTIQMAGSAVPHPMRLQAQVLTSRDGCTRIRYLSPPLTGVTIWEDEQHTYRYNPRRKRLTIAARSTSPEERKREPTHLLESYAPRVVKQDTVAGHAATVVELRPRRGTGHWRRLWIDPTNGVILRDEQRAGQEKPERATEYTSVTYLPSDQNPSPEEFQPPAALVRAYGVARPGDTSSRFEPDQLSRLLGFTVQVPKWLPAGYTLRGAYQTPRSNDPHHQAARLLFSDGLSTITVLECGHAPDQPSCFANDGKSGLSVHHEAKDHSYLAIGDVPRSDLERVVKSVAP